jgi:hypothetical protein
MYRGPVRAGGTSREPAFPGGQAVKTVTPEVSASKKDTNEPTYVDPPGYGGGLPLKTCRGARTICNGDRSRRGGGRPMGFELETLSTQRFNLSAAVGQARAARVYPMVLRLSPPAKRDLGR